ncbi:coiled-coil domain-containing protein 159 isoform X1 [Cricetulus griseus]|uniref:Coiled-coil domain-containing protein 159 isoform X1 n=2 Tax=Cricetulus griseus TaxID=10029 RepID=A0A9J7FXD8_CRIGR|nr:coiled-coil domain-containing protein 159 isoform X1 [Cricetulus griseus]XP_027267376.1 coiled-coil domain-containing protein 159 isoform X1 [Cricetulus griseus]
MTPPSATLRFPAMVSPRDQNFFVTAGDWLRGPWWESMNRCDPLLAGLPWDSDYGVSYLSSPPPLSIPSWPAKEKRDRALDCMTRRSRTLEPEIVNAVSQQASKSVSWRQEWDLTSQPNEGTSCSNSDSDFYKEHNHDQDFVKRTHSTTKKSLEPCSSKVKGEHPLPVKNTMLIPDSQKFFQCELESLRTQLQAQTKAFEFLNHSVTMLEKESCLQQIKIQQLEEVWSPLSLQGEKEGRKRAEDQSQQELHGALAQGLQELQKTLRDSEELQQARTTRCLQLLAQEIRDSKKFLWEELELVREEVTFIYQKLQAQEDEISENLLNIQKMQKTQVKCRKVLTKMKQQAYEPCSYPEAEEVLAEGNCTWKDDLQKELSNIWSAVHSLQNSIDCLALSMGTRPRASCLKGHKGHLCLSSQYPSWDSDSDWETPFSKNGSYPPGTDPPQPLSNPYHLPPPL